eukprot:c8405_g1_i2.p1 GENE.c8405_g1_i2~~c8405_g1_i2.p1  ORF type:complete len:155 (+),score=28.41 c8405_g1_i2:107-571(+)
MRIRLLCSSLLGAATVRFGDQSTYTTRYTPTQKFEPTWIEFASRIDREVTIGQVDCVASKNICSKYEVSGYPTLKLLRRGTVIDEYFGSRTTEGLTEFVRKSVPNLGEEMPIHSLRRSTRRPRPRPAVTASAPIDIRTEVVTASEKQSISHSEL